VLVEDDDVEALGCQLPRARKPGGAAADDGHAVPVRRPGAAKRLGGAAGDVGRVALERGDRDRRLTLVLEDAGRLAQDLDRADARARSPEEVLAVDRAGRSEGVAGRELADEAGDVDVGGAGRRAGRRGPRPGAV